MNLAFLIDFGSTFTKVTVVDVDGASVVARGEAPSTVQTDVREGLVRALAAAHRCSGVFSDVPEDLGVLGNHTVLASSSAAGGLRMAVIGLVPGLTVQAATTAALGAGAKLVGAWSFKVADRAIAEIEASRPDLILLTGGTDGGDVATILHNARILAGSSIAAPVIVAGNRSAADEVAAVLRHGGKTVRRAENVMSGNGRLTVDSAREEIRTLFMERITHAKGLEQLGDLVPVVLPTPLAVLRGALLGAQGTGRERGWGDMLVVDVGGATTDVHSLAEGTPGGPHMAEPGLPEPYAKRTVEGDLGIRFNAGTLVDRVGAARFERDFRAAFPQFGVTTAVLTDYLNELTRRTALTPAEPWQSAVDAQLARVAVDLAIERHAGKRERIVAREGEDWMHYGKDLSDVHTVVGTGGVFVHNPYAAHILSGSREGSGRHEVLRPKAPRFFTDAAYSLYAAGLLAETLPEVAWRIFAAGMKPVAPRTPVE